MVSRAEVVWNGCCISGALQQASHGVPTERKEGLCNDRDPQLLSNVMQCSIVRRAIRCLFTTNCHQMAQHMPLKHTASRQHIADTMWQSLLMAKAGSERCTHYCLQSLPLSIL